MTAVELGTAYRERSLSPVAVTSATLARIDALDRNLHSYITLSGDGALADARASEARFLAGSPRGPLDGIPIGLKDLFDTARLRTTANSRLYADRVPAEDADVVANLRATGAVIVGKHAMTELAVGRITQDEPLFPDARNPWDLARVTGSSSSGSVAAVAAGLCVGAFGSDSGGSIRGPAALCGVVGFKPTYDRLSRRGILPLAPSLDHAGPIARSVGDTRLLFEGARREGPLGGGGRRPDSAMGAGQDLRGVRVLAPLGMVEAMDQIHPDMMAAYRRALAVMAELGASVDTTGKIAEARYAGLVGSTIVGVEALSLYGPIARTRPEVFGRAVYTRLLEGALVSAEEYVDVLRARGRIAHGIARAMRAADVIALPTALRGAWRFDEEPKGAQGVFLQAFNLTGQPAITIPCGMSAGFPLGLHLAARPHEDEKLLDIAETLEVAVSPVRPFPALGKLS